VNVKPPLGGKTDFTVRSPIATASVRGTVFDFDGSRLLVEEGRVYLAGADAAGAYISGGHGSDGEAGKTAAVIETVKEELSPALPAGVDTVQAGITAAPSSANLDIRFDWRDQ
jgi:hypothetical protein